MDKKRGFLIFGFLTFIFSCFFNIKSANAIYMNGVELNQNFFDTGWELLEGKNYNYFNNSNYSGTAEKIYYQKDFPYVYCSSYGGSNFNCSFLTDFTFYNKNSSWITLSTSTASKYSMFPGFKYNTSNNEFSYYSANNAIIHIANNTTYTNFDIYDGNTLLKSKNFNYLAINNHNVIFHFDGATNMVFNTSTMLFDTYENNVTLKTGTSEFNRFFNGTIIKQGYDFMGWYYDENFIEPYSNDDNIDNDIDLYAKFVSKIYYVNDIDYIEIKFDNLPLMSTNINYDYTIKSVFEDGNDYFVDFSQPFGREFYTGCSEENDNCSSDLKYKDKLFYDLDFIGYYYTYSEDIIFNSNANHITSSYSIIVPLQSSIANWIYVDFNSNYDYEIIVHYKNDFNDSTSVSNYLQTIDLTNKYGVIFLPLYDNSVYADIDSYYITHFGVSGTVDIQVTDSRDLKDYNILQLYSMNYCNSFYLSQSDIPYNCDNLTGIFNFKIDNLTSGQTLRFVNVNYSSSFDVPVRITFDTRFFNYGILDSSFSSVDVIDPTTGESYNVGLIDFYNKFNTFDSSKQFKISLNRFIEPIRFIFIYITRIFNNYISSNLQDYFFFVFCLSLILILMRIIF